MGKLRKTMITGAAALGIYALATGSPNENPQEIRPYICSSFASSIGEAIYEPTSIVVLQSGEEHYRIFVREDDAIAYRLGSSCHEHVPGDNIPLSLEDAIEKKFGEKEFK